MRSSISLLSRFDRINNLMKMGELLLFFFSLFFFLLFAVFPLSLIVSFLLFFPLIYLDKKHEEDGSSEEQVNEGSNYDENNAAPMLYSFDHDF